MVKRIVVYTSQIQNYLLIRSCISQYLFCSTATSMPRTSIICWFRKISSFSGKAYLPKLFDACAFAKNKRFSCSIHKNKSTSPFKIDRTDVWDPSRIATTPINRRFFTFIDCYSCVTWLNLLYNNSDVFTFVQSFYRMVAKQFDAKVRNLRSDIRREYKDRKFQNIFYKYCNC